MLRIAPGLIPVKAPASARGDLDTTYLDDELRVGRGNRGNLFVLRMADRSVKPRRPRAVVPSFYLEFALLLILPAGN